MTSPSKLLEVAFLPRLSHAAREQAVAGEQVGRAARRVGPVSASATEPGVWPCRWMTSKDSSPTSIVSPSARIRSGCHRQRLGVELVRGGRGPGRLGHLRQGQPVVADAGGW